MFTHFGLCLLILCQVFLVNTLVDFYGSSSIPVFLCDSFVAVLSVMYQAGSNILGVKQNKTGGFAFQSL